MRKEEKDNQTKPVAYEEVNLNEAGTKFQNIILCYPFNPLKVEFRNVPWFGRYDLALSRPFCGLIEQCHREGFVVYSDWLNIIGSKRSGFYGNETREIREKINIHLKDLTDSIGYAKEKHKIVVNNQFKELNSWLNKIYMKLYKMDKEGGWDAAYIKQIERSKKVVEAYKQYRKDKKRRLMNVIEKCKDDLAKLLPPLFKTEVRKNKARIIPKNLSERDKLINKIKRYDYNESDVKQKSYIDIPLRNAFQETFFIYHMDATKENILTAQEFEDQINEIFRLLGNEWVTFVNGKLMLLGNSAEEIEEKQTYKLLEEYPRVIKNLRKAQKNIMDADWNDVPHYCCKAIEGFYNVLLKNKRQYEDKTLSQLTNIIRRQEELLFKESVIGVKGGLDHLILSALNLVGSIRNRRDSGHGNITDVPEWEAKMSYSFTLLLLKTLQEFKVK